MTCNVTCLLKPDTELTTHCYHFPAKDYGHTNNVKLLYGASPKGINFIIMNKYKKYITIII